MAKYVKTVPIEAVQFDGSKEMIDKYGLGHRRDYEKPWLDQITIWTLEGEMQIFKGDWLVTGINGEHWAINNDIFLRTYAELPKVPQFVADWIEFNRGKSNIADMIESSRWRIIKFDQYEEIEKWINADFERFARAWLDGYQVAD